MSVEQVYDFEGIIEAAVKAIFTAADLECFVTADKPDLTRERPRVEALFILGAARGQFIPLSGTAWQGIRNHSWSGQLKFDLVTDANSAIHGAYRAKIRDFCANLGQRINGAAPMRYHKVQTPVLDTGTSPMWKPQDGNYRSTMTFNLDISINNNAWALLDTNL